MKAAIEWFAEHRVAANMLMVLIVVGGLLTLTTVEQEVFPQVDADTISVSVVFLGASPEEVEEGVCIKIEEAVQGLEGIERISSRAVQGLGTVTIEASEDAEFRDVLDDVKTAVDAIDSFPDLAESPVIREFENVRQVLSVAVHGPADERTLRLLAERTRDELLALPDVTRARLSSVRPYEVSIEVSEQTLRRYGLTFDEVTAAVRAGSLDLTGGSVKTEGGEVLLRTKAQAYRRPDFEDLVLRSGPDGSRLELRDVATVVDGFEDTGQSGRFDGEPVAMVDVFRVGDQRALDVAEAVHAWVDQARPRMPEGISLTIWQDDSLVLKSRLDLLARNGRAGLLLVFLTLALFLRLTLAAWVTLGIPIAFLGAVWLMPALGVSVNMISLFGFLMALGIVVDDAIVVGENIYRHHEQGAEGLEAVKQGVGQVYIPVTFAVLTTVAAFSPLIGIPGLIGKFISQLPLVVVPTLAFSLVESLLVLPTHLSHLRRRTVEASWLPVRLWEAVQRRVSDVLEAVIDRVYRPLLALAVEWRHATLGLGVATCLVTFSLFGSGHMRFVFFPDVEADNVLAWVTMPQGTPEAVTREAMQRIEAAAWQLDAEVRERLGEPAFVHLRNSVGEQPFRNDQATGFGNTANFVGAHLGEMNLALQSGEDRNVTSTELQQRWRELTGPIPGAVELVFSSQAVATGEAIDVELKGHDVARLRDAAGRLKEALRGYAGVFDVTDSFRAGKQELLLEVLPEAEARGIDRADLARQVRQGFYGDEAQRIQRGRDEVKVMVRYPADDRRSLADVAAMRVRLPDGTAIPLPQVARLESGRSDAVIQRSDRRRSVNVTADVDLGVNDPNAILADVQATVLPRILADHPGMSYSLEGEQKEQSETVAGLIRGFILALFLIYALLSIPFRSYWQPAIVMSAIPFGVVGAIWGHLIVGLDLTVMSMFGLVALTGVIVNDSLVMVDFINGERRGGATLEQAVLTAGPARFRPILLTSLTTFAGLLPLLLERSMQAKFLIPMAVSLGFGVMFATFITLLLVPAATLALEDLTGGLRRLLGRPAPAEG